MINIATATKTTIAKPSQIFKLWADVEHWPVWDDSIEWVKLSGQFATGGKTKLKPKGGPAVKSVLASVEVDKSFVDVSSLPGAKLTFNHTISVTGAKTTVTHQVTMSGLMAVFWAKVMGANLRSGLQPALNKLVNLAEGNE